MKNRYTSSFAGRYGKTVGTMKISIKSSIYSQDQIIFSWFFQVVFKKSQYFAHKPMLDSLKSCFEPCKQQIISFCIGLYRYHPYTTSRRLCYAPSNLSYAISHRQFIDRSSIYHPYIIDRSSIYHRWMIDISSMDHRYIIDSSTIGKFYFVVRRSLL